MPRTNRIIAPRAPLGRGFSLVELLVGLAISIIGMVGMTAAFIAYEGPRRTTLSGDAAQQNGSWALFELGRQIRTAGSGLAQSRTYGLFGCPIQAYGSTGNLILPGTLPAPFSAWSLGTPSSTLLAMPVLVAAGAVDGAGNAASAMLAIVSGNPAGTVFATPVQGAASNTLIVGNTFGIAANDYLLQTPTTAGGNCLVSQTSQVDGVPNNTITLATALPSGYTPAYAFDLGPRPVLSLYGVDPATDTLTTFDLLGRTDSPLPLADGILAIQALYGVDDGICNASFALPGCGVADDGVIDEWVKPTGDWSIQTLTASPTAAAQAATRIKAIRLAVVARSQLPEQNTAYTGATSLTLFQDLPAALQYVIATQTQYRYKVYDTAIPIRNMLINRFY